MTYHGIGGAGYVLPGAQVYSAVVAAAAGGGGFAPTDIGGCALWLDASDVSSLYQDTAGSTAVTADGQTIGRWSDKSGNSRHATQATAGNQPTYQTSVQNGLSIVRFSSNFLDIAWSLTLTSQSVFVLFSWYAGTSFQRVFTQSDASADSSTLGHYIPVLRASVSDEFGAYAASSMRANVAFAQNTKSVFTAVHTGSEIQNRLNGGTAITYTHALNKAFTRARIGSSFAPDRPLTGDICEIIIYNSALSTTDRESVESYLSTKWGL